MTEKPSLVLLLSSRLKGAFSLGGHTAPQDLLASGAIDNFDVVMFASLLCGALGSAWSPRAA